MRRRKIRYRYYSREENETIYAGVRRAYTKSGYVQRHYSALAITLAIEVPAGMENIKIDSSCGDIIVEYGDERRTYSRSGKIRHGNGETVIVANTVSDDIKIAG